MRKALRRYLPPILLDTCEFNLLCDAEQPEIDALHDGTDAVLDAQFVSTAPEYAIARYEKIFSIAPGDTDTLDDRRFRVLLRISDQLPYSMGWLRRKLDTLFGAGNYQITRDMAAHKLAVEADVQFESVIVSLYDDLRVSIPANLVLETYISSALPTALYGACWMQTLDEVYL